MSARRTQRPLEPDQLDVLIASDDRNFLRLAGAVLGNDGHRTVRSGVSAQRIERLTRLHHPDVLVLDGHGDEVAVAEVCSSLLARGRAVALVLVGDDGRDVAGLPVVARWGSPEALLEAVRRAGGLDAAPLAPVPAAASASAGALRLVPDPAS